MNLWEILFKIGTSVIIIIAICWQLFFLKWLWVNQIDLKITFARLIKLPAPKTDMIATRDPNKIYQKGNAVGKIVGNIGIENDTLIFEKLTEVEFLNKKEPFEYKYDKYVIIESGPSSVLSLNISKGSKEPNVLQNVVCKRIKYNI